MNENMGVWLEGGHYLVFRDGRILNTKTKKNIGGNNSKLKKGYPSHHLLGSYHRVMAECFLGGIPQNMVVNHIDGNKRNYEISNLEIVNQQENIIHAFRVGLNSGNKGSKNSQAKLLERDVFNMYDLFLKGYTNEEVASIYDVDSRYVSLIRHGKRWVHLYDYVGKTFPMSYKYRVCKDALMTSKALLDIGYTN